MNYDKAIEKVRELNVENKFEEAIHLLKSIKKEGEDDIKWYYRYSCALIHTNKFKKALDILKDGMSKSKDNFPYAHLNLGMLYYWKGKLVDAFKIVEEGLEKCKLYEPEYVWEFEQTLKSMYLGYPFANKENAFLSVLNQDFPNYDENADSKYKIKNIEREKENLSVYFGNYKRERVNLYLYINGRILPQFRYGYEEILGYELAKNRLGVLTGSGTLTDKNGRPTACDISFDIFADVEEYKNKFLDILENNLLLPKGSYLKIIYGDEKEERIELGKYDILALGMDTRGISDEIVQKYNGGKLIERIQLECRYKKIDGGYYFNYEETNERVWLRFLGVDYEEMEKIIKKSITNYPLCKDTIIIDETHIIQELEEIEEEANVFLN